MAPTDAGRRASVGPHLPDGWLILEHLHRHCRRRPLRLPHLTPRAPQATTARRRPPPPWRRTRTARPARVCARCIHARTCAACVNEYSQSAPPAFESPHLAVAPLGDEPCERQVRKLLLIPLVNLPLRPRPRERVGVRIGGGESAAAQRLREAHCRRRARDRGQGRRGRGGGGGGRDRLLRVGYGGAVERQLRHERVAQRLERLGAARPVAHVEAARAAVEKVDRHAVLPHRNTARAQHEEREETLKRRQKQREQRAKTTPTRRGVRRNATMRSGDQHATT
eukprot:96693-Pleurochrysis_carterae.AAC.1